MREARTHWSLTNTPSHLQITTQKKDIFQSINSAPILLQAPPPGDLDIDTRISMAPTENYIQGGPIMYSDDDNYIRLTYGYFDGPKFEFGKEVNGKAEFIKVPAPRADSFYLRISKIGQNFSGYYSSDGNEWILIGKYLDTKSDIAGIGLTAFSSTASSAEIPADFDFFYVTCEDGC